MRTPQLAAIAILCLAIALGALAPPAVAQTPAPAPEIAQRYRLEAAFDPAAATLAGTLAVTWTNTTGEPQASLPFRMYPNGAHYGDAGITLDGLTVAGEPAFAEGDADPTVMRVPLGEPVPPGGSRELELGFTTVIPVDSAGSFGLFRGNTADGSWALVNWYPLVAGWEPGEGWNLAAPIHNVDPTFVTVSAWEAEIAHPADIVLVSGGEETVRREGGGAVTEITLAPGRELAMTAYPAAAIVTETAEVDGVDVTVTLQAAHDVPGMRAALIDAAQVALPRLGAWFAYPYDAPELDITTIALDGALGVSWTGIVWMDLEQLTADGALEPVERESLTLVLYHELAHQWLGSIIGVDTNDHAFVTEALASVLTVAIVRDTDGPEAAVRAFGGFVSGPYRAFVNGRQDAVANSPAAALEPVVHGIVVYGKAGVGFEAIRQAMGDEAFTAGLASLGARAWEVVSPAEVRAAFEAASGDDLGALWAFWFEQEGATTVADIDAVVAGAGD